MRPGGGLYVPGAEKILPNLDRLVDQARRGRVLLISSADAHAPDESEFQQWPPHCVKGTPGAELVSEARALPVLVFANQPDFVFPAERGAWRQVLLEKSTLDVFDNPNTEKLLSCLSASERAAAASRPHFFVFGVVTEYCVHRTADGLLSRGHRVSIVEDAIQSLDDTKGREILDGLQVRGADLVTTDQALALLCHHAPEAAESEQRNSAGN